MKDQNLLWSRSADTNYLILVKNTTNESDSVTVFFFSELSIQIITLHLFSSFNYLITLLTSVFLFFFFLIDNPVFVLFEGAQKLTLFLIKLLKHSALSCLILEGLNVNLAFPQ